MLYPPAVVAALMPLRRAPVNNEKPRSDLALRGFSSNQAQCFLSAQMVRYDR